MRKLLSRRAFAKSMYREQGYSVNERVNVGTRVCLHSKVADLNQIHADFQPMNQRNIVTEETFPCKKILKLLRKTLLYFILIYFSRSKKIY